ncbi:MAG: urease accessory UreF family protein [Burkholderiaceae bacterium]
MSPIHTSGRASPAASPTMLATDAFERGTMTHGVTGSLAALSMLRLASPSLPIGGFSYSQGLEPAIVAGWVEDERSLVDWLGSLIDSSLASYEAPLCWRLFGALRSRHMRAALHWHDDFLATRETAELRAETLQMGYSLLKLLTDTHDASGWVAGVARRRLDERRETALPLAYGLASLAFGIERSAALQAYAWTWLENQVAAAIKAVPLGQQCGQRVFDALLPRLGTALEQAPHRRESEWSNFTPGLALASSWHETQYSRLFRS